MPREHSPSLIEVSREEMISNGVQYCLVMQRTKLPIRRVDLIKVAFANPSANNAIVLKELEDVLDEVFGIRLVDINDNPNPKRPSSSYILVSNFFKLSNYKIPNDADDTRNALLLMILSAIFMTGQNVDEDNVWKIIQELQLQPTTCSKREELHRFLKNTYILPLYLTMEQVSDATDENVARYRYGWGFRAEMEVSKYLILKFAAQAFPGKKPADFANQFAIISSSRREQKLADDDELDEHQEMRAIQCNSTDESNNEDEEESIDSQVIEL